MNWNLKLIYETKEERDNDFNSLDSLVKGIKDLKGKLGTYDGLKSYMYLYRELNLKLSRLFTYYSMQKDMNQKNTDSTREFSVILNKYYDIVSALSFVETELVGYGKDKVLSLIDNELEPLRFSMIKMFDSKKHIMSEKVEEIISNYTGVSNSFSRLYDNLSIVDSKSVKVKLSNGKVIESTKQLLPFNLSTLENQKDRKKVFESVYKYYDDHKETYAAIYDGMASAELAFAVSIAS